MSQDYVNKLQNIYAAFAKGDVPTVLGALDPNVEWWEAENFLYADGNPYKGPQAVLTGVFMRLAGDWENFALDVKELFDAGDTVISAGYYTGTHKRTGKFVRAQFSHFFTFQDGRVVKFQQYTDTAQFKDAAT
jgi:ketosteroid isomerase-like protein